MHFKVHITSNIMIAFKTRSTFHFQHKLKNQEAKKKLKEEGERRQTQLDQSVRLTRLTFDTGSVIEIKVWSSWCQMGSNWSELKHSTKRKASDGYETQQHHELKP